MTDWTRFMNQPPAEFTRQEKINGVVAQIYRQTGRSYDEVADALERGADDPNIQGMVANHAGVDSVTADELRVAAAFARRRHEEVR